MNGRKEVEDLMVVLRGMKICGGGGWFTFPLQHTYMYARVCQEHARTHVLPVQGRSICGFISTQDLQFNR